MAMIRVAKDGVMTMRHRGYPTHYSGDNGASWVTERAVAVADVKAAARMYRIQCAAERMWFAGHVHDDFCCRYLD